MKAKLLYLSIISVGLWLLPACTNETSNTQDSNCVEVKKLTGERKNLNVNILLDLSDRISPTMNPNNSMNYWERDLGYISSICYAFENHVRNKRTILINDHIKLFCHPLPENLDNINTVFSSLDKMFDKSNATIENICSISNDYNQLANALYTKTLDNKEPKAKNGIDDYPGADIYDFFKSKVKDYCIIPDHRNILIIITDGYLYMKNNTIKNADNSSNYILSKTLKDWGFTSQNYKDKIYGEGYKLIPATDNLENLEVLVLGINPKNNWEQEVLEIYWEKWLKEMNVKNFGEIDSKKYLKKADLPSELNSFIESFIYQ